MKGPRALLEAEDHWVTSLGAFIPSEGRVVMHGKDLHHDLAELSWMDLLMFAICGRRFTAAQLRLFQGLWKIGGSYPEPRIWNNRVAALGGSARSSPGLAFSAATAISEARIYGRGPDLKAFDFLTRCRIQLQEGVPLAEIIETTLRQNRAVPGYGRPLRSEDERLRPMMELAESLSLTDGPHLKLAFDIKDYLVKRRMGMNAASMAAALCADQGLTPAEYHRGCLVLFSIGFIACEYDARQHIEGEFMPLRCTRVVYGGPTPRSWPKGGHRVPRNEPGEPK